MQNIFKNMPILDIGVESNRPEAITTDHTTTRDQLRILSVINCCAVGFGLPSIKETNNPFTIKVTGVATKTLEDVPDNKDPKAFFTQWPWMQQGETVTEHSRITNILKVIRPHLGEHAFKMTPIYLKNYKTIVDKPLFARIILSLRYSPEAFQNLSNHKILEVNKWLAYIENDIKT